MKENVKKKGKALAQEKRQRKEREERKNILRLPNHASYSTNYSTNFHIILTYYAST